MADSTLYFDSATKTAPYVRAGIADYWVLDLTSRRMIVHRDPREGRYSSIVVYSSEERVSPLAAPNRSVKSQTPLCASRALT